MYRGPVRWLLVMWLGLGMSAGVGAAEAAASTDAQRAARYAAALETNPLGAEAPEQREWLLAWLVEAPDFSVTACDILGPVSADETVPHRRELVLQQLFGNVAHQIAHPGRSDAMSRQMAGIESVLKAYSAMLVDEPEAHVPYFDDLLLERAQGSLEARMKPLIAERCIQKDPEA